MMTPVLMARALMTDCSWSHMLEVGAASLAYLARLAAINFGGYPIKEHLSGPHRSSSSRSAFYECPFA
jgi:hypothetical protein